DPGRLARRATGRRRARPVGARSPRQGSAGGRSSPSVSARSSPAMKEINAVVDEMTDRLARASLRVNLAWWDLQLTSSEKAAAEKTAAELALREVLADGDAFATLRAARERPPKDALLARQAERLFLEALPQQAPADLRRAMAELETSISATYNS